MRQNIVLIGNSPLVFFLARQLDASVADLVHFNVIWLTTEDTMPGLGNAGHKKIVFKDKLQNVKLVKTEVKSISLRSKHVITPRGIIDYKFLFIDQAPYYREAELKRINSSVDELVMSLQAYYNQGKKSFAKIIVKGDSAEALQLACSVSDRVRRHGTHATSRVMVSHDIDIKDPKLKGFLSNSIQDIKLLKEKATALSIEAPRPMVDLKTLKGLRLDKSGQAMVEVDGFVSGYPEVIILNEVDRAWQNLLRVEKSLASSLTANVESFFMGLKSEPRGEEDDEAFKLSKEGGKYVKLGDISSAHIRAYLIIQLDILLLKSLRT